MAKYALLSRATPVALSRLRPLRQALSHHPPPRIIGEMLGLVRGLDDHCRPGEDEEDSSEDDSESDSSTSDEDSDATSTSLADGSEGEDAMCLRDVDEKNRQLQGEDGAPLLSSVASGSAGATPASRLQLQLHNSYSTSCPASATTMRQYWDRLYRESQVNNNFLCQYLQSGFDTHILGSATTNAGGPYRQISKKLAVAKRYRKVLRLVNANRFSLLKAPTGTGKSTLVALMIAHNEICVRKKPCRIAVVQPRRETCKSLYARLAQDVCGVFGERKAKFA
ncbi:unnamed protein product, partial [Amoebophrya sp. A120]|eukprot:GSA120T00000930001.1